MEGGRRDTEKQLSTGLPSRVIAADFPMVLERVSSLARQVSEQTKQIERIPNPVVQEITLPEIERFAEAIEACIALYSAAIASANVPLPDRFWETVNSREPGAFEKVDAFVDELKAG